MDKTQAKIDSFKRGRTGRGFAILEFSDANGEKCSLQKSSVATADMAWLGLSKPIYCNGFYLCQMHLTTKMAKELARELNYFARHGSLDLKENNDET